MRVVLAAGRGTLPGEKAQFLMKASRSNQYEKDLRTGRLGAPEGKLKNLGPERLKSAA